MDYSAAIGDETVIPIINKNGEKYTQIKREVEMGRISEAELIDLTKTAAKQGIEEYFKQFNLEPTHLVYIKSLYDSAHETKSFTKQSLIDAAVVSIFSSIGTATALIALGINNLI